uniref:BPTI/Kunitz inhibitor domain-containing protein n=1 Tax=Biomphalaria glabrata TaxID=6526 RepID=A0A2C9JGS2_BIOGL
MQLQLVLCFKALWMFTMSEFQRPPICDLEEESGPCRALHSRYYYDSKGGACYNFKYGGCQGNANNFQTKEECEAKCMGMASANFTSKDVQSKSPTEASHCYLSSETGLCKASIEMYHYDPSTQKCFTFYYSGCGGNDNRFESEELCLANCTKPARPPLGPLGPVVDICQETMEVGPCRAMIPRYYFDTATRSCQLFHYGGCKGNNNKFETKEQCEAKCLPADRKDGGQRDIKWTQGVKDGKCLLEMDSGPCKALLSRYYYDQSTNTCQNFKYGGCSGNDNNFQSKSDCEEACLTKTVRTFTDSDNAATSKRPLRLWSVMVLLAIMKLGHGQ